MKNNTARTSLSPGVPWTLPDSHQPDGPAKVYLAAVAPDLELTVLPLCRATEFLPCFDESDVCHRYRVRGFWLVLAAGLFCAAFAGFDEYHQMFVAGRTPSRKDVMIDSAGSITGIYMTRMIGFIGRKTVFAPLAMERRKRR